MKINEKILHIPPYISTAWKNVQSIHREEKQNRVILVFSMKDGSRISIPDLDQSLLNEIFACHEKALEKTPDEPLARKEGFNMGFPLKIGMGGVDGISNPMQHNPQQGNMPDLPPEVLEKVVSIARALGMDQFEEFPKAEPHCNCVYCQIARSLHKDIIADSEDEITDDDLKFREWDIEQKDQKVYSVRNPLDETEHYDVFLGEPLGCTCGSKNCEHIRAVLES